MTAVVFRLSVIEPEVVTGLPLTDRSVDETPIEVTVPEPLLLNVFQSVLDR